jgi:hypothetical protein
MHVSQHQPSVGGEPEPGGNGRRSLYVPVRRGPAGDVVRLWRTPFGTRTAVAFTTDRLLRSVLGPTQPWIRLSESALRGLAEPLGALRLTVDPVLTARPPASWSEPAVSEPCAADETAADQTATETGEDTTAADGTRAGDTSGETGPASGAKAQAPTP